ncbi:MAG: NarL family transcriptional regulator [Oscillatoria sp. PMC 1068.18]|nr:NarL family transcriptional regulator [Oscillatoria sp. PMC 1076.18]MEC4988645.1 NarL family transcriptional regulator [Oscillatoria sp. PMC 1068.18]
MVRYSAEKLIKTRQGELSVATKPINLSSPQKEDHTAIVNSHNDWDSLQEVIVGRVQGASVPQLEANIKVDSPPQYWDFFQQYQGQPFPDEWLKAATQELDEFCHVLQQEGITVRRPDLVDFSQPYQTPDFRASGLYAAMPRDLLIVIGNEIIEAPLAWRSRFFEYRAYRSLIKEYFQQGAKWTTVPKPLMSDELYDFEFAAKTPEEQEALVKQGKFVTTEFEPCFDAADIVRLGRDLFVQRSHVTNKLGITWLARHLDSEYRVHLIDFADFNPMHIDASLVPLRPGLALINPDRPPLPDSAKIFTQAGWDLIEAAPPTTPDSWPLPIASKWVSMNLLSLDTKRVIVEKQEEATQKLLKDLGFTVIPVNFRHFYTFGGSFHCATCDLRRDSQLEDYGFSDAHSSR